MSSTVPNNPVQDESNEHELEHVTVHFRSIQEPYTLRDEASRCSMYSTLNTGSIQSMLSGGLERFYEKYGKTLRRENLHLPTPELRFDNLSYSVTCRKHTEGDSKGTVGSALKSLISCLIKQETFDKTILKPMSGIIRPGSMTLVLGGPGCGKSTFLKALGGKLLHDKIHEVNGQVLYSGLDASQVELSKLVGLVDQTDDHCATLTVRETIKFADACLNGLVDKQPDNLQGIAALRTELMLHILGLNSCADTVVGDALLRGVSGGERKRVTIGEMLVGGQSIFICDEISTGLDSAATYDIMKALRTWTETLGGSCVVALLQPPPEVVDLFDDVLLLSQGHLVYQGSRKSVLPYFTKLGFTCPEDVDPADYLIEVTEGRGFEFRNGLVDPETIPLTAADFAHRFQQSDIYCKTLLELHKGFNLPTTYEKPEDFQQIKSIGNLTYSKRASPFAMKFVESTMLLLKRQVLITLRDRPLLYGKMIEAFTVGLLLGMVYYMAETSLYLRMMFFSVAIFQRQAWQQITICFQLRTIFYKQRSRNFFRTLSYGIAEAVVMIPINLTVSLLMGTLFYFMSGLTLDAGRYTTFVLILVAFQHAIGAYFTFLSALSPTITVAQALAGMSVCFFLLFSGNIILADLIPDYWIWMYWFDPLSWALRSVILNEFTSDRYDAIQTQARLEQFQMKTDVAYIWIGIAVLFFYYFLFTCAETLTLHFIRYDQKKVISIENKKSTQEYNTSEEAIIKCSSATYKKSGDVMQDDQQFVPAYLCIENLKYTVDTKDGPVQLLKGITAYFEPGTMTALMGSSGAGKTTLLDVIAGRKTGGVIEGRVLINGELKNQNNFSRIAAYCEQMDIHSGASTVLESLYFSANLRLPPTTSTEYKNDLVQDTMDLLELNDVAHCIVGTPSTGGLSVEQRKRLTIAVELVSNPSILFLDEPTSGLDARSAQVVMRGVQRIARSGRTVVCTIHQPSVSIFNLFDHLLLLQRGGTTAYFGSLGQGSEHMLGYFASIPGTSAIQPLYNPATYMLEVIGAGIGREGQNTTNYSDSYAESELKKKNDAQTQALSTPRSFMKPFPDYAPIATGLWNQIRETTIKATKTYWRSPNYNFVRIVLFPLFAVIFGTTFYQMKRDTEGKVNSQIALIYNSMDFIGVINLMTVLEITCAERAVFYRERSVNMYGPFPYSFAMFIAELPYLLFVSIIFIGVEYWLVGLEEQIDSFAFFWFVFFLYISICTFFGQWMSALMPNTKVANVAVGAASCLFNLFSGYLLPFIKMKSYYKWIIYIMPSSYTLNALVTSQMGLCENGKGNGCQDITLTDKSTIQLSSFIHSKYGFDADNRFSDMGVLIAMWVMIQAFIYLTLRYVSHLKR